MMWKEKYRVGVDLIDHQHYELFSRVSQFLQAMQEEGDWDSKLDEVKRTMVFMQNYVVEHFTDEERYQREISYPGYEAHKKAHDDFKATVGEYAKSFESEGYTQELVQEFGAKLMTWLIMHVAAADQRIGAYVRQQGGEGQ
ncbi:MAG: hemerythrin family protein [Firmicutes bacterium]|jgi:hemerythrin|nr:hemerythrin family protein [Bacillota bacterium]